MIPADPGTVRGRWLRCVYATARVPDSVRVLLLVLAEHMDDDGRVEVGRDELATLLSRSPQRVSTRLSDAVGAGLLHQVRRGNRGAKSAFQALIPEEESVTPGGDTFPRKQVSISRPLSEETSLPRGGPVSQETDRPRGRLEGPSSSPPGVTKTAAPIGEGAREHPPQTTPADSPERPDTPAPIGHKRVNALATVYHRATNGMGDWNKIRAVVKKALNSGYSDAEITRGLEHVAAEGRFALTADTLRIAINRTAPRPHLRVVGDHTPYRNPTDYGDDPDPWS
ncbi:Uncharacterised protein [Nocardiopsis dassonvillei]|uniref:Helix-turn-helix domain-containing protein n=2 Tax=Nocardiopsis dassonvillei TaxID=2014 RepID=D7AX70_NOCDD|nr:hypothetical protein Ndas_4451 [Nocardiopsis dassonvillei subsp. dassonvillei DSM 43111]VEI90352.1 Uncharacterised protein [Nocardiopsis dassonvillei]